MVSIKKRNLHAALRDDGSHFGAEWPIPPFKHFNQAPSDVFQKKGGGGYIWNETGWCFIASPIARFYYILVGQQNTLQQQAAKTPHTAA